MVIFSRCTISGVIAVLNVLVIKPIGTTIPGCTITVTGASLIVRKLIFGVMTIFRGTTQRYTGVCVGVAVATMGTAANAVHTIATHTTDLCPAHLIKSIR